MNTLVARLKSGISSIGRRIFRPSNGRPGSFRAAFEQFRQVLDLHNTAAGMIADMGETLSGEYLFDIVYIRQAYDGLSRIFSSLLEQFLVLTGGKYRTLESRFNSIDHEIRRLIDNNAEPSADLVLSIAASGSSRAKDVGGKMANLGELSRLTGITVPEGFVVTTRSFVEFMSYNGLAEQTARLSADWETNPSLFNEIREAIRSGDLPPAVRDAVAVSLEDLAKSHPGGSLSVRSSAVGEDGEFTFAGQFESVLNVPFDMTALTAAYKEVLASLFAPRPFHYCEKIGCDPAEIRMAVGCIMMVDAVSSGVIYSANPDSSTDELLVSATWRLGKALVEGQVDADEYRLSRSPHPSVIGRRIGAKTTLITSSFGSGTTVSETPSDLIHAAVLDDRSLTRLAAQALTIERHFRRPQDIEWAIDKDGAITMLQARPLPLHPETGTGTPASTSDSLTVLHTLTGTAVRKGYSAGTVYVADASESLEDFPRGGILVARHDSSQFIRIMPFASAILTEQGSATSHMAALCREFRVPTLVNCGPLRELLENGRKITVQIGDNAATLYDGIHQSPHADGGDGLSVEELYEFRSKKYLLRHIVPLNLIDPFRDDFSPDACRTLHDILRFVHEKMVMELVETAEHGQTDSSAVSIDLPVPAGIVAIDLGGGIAPLGDRKTATIEKVSSVPFRAVLDGMTHPGAWHTDVVALHAGDLIAGMMKLSDITAPSSSVPTANLAVVSREYLNLSLKFGYHYTLIDSYCSPNRTNNHIYFRFSGGATDITKRSRRARLIEIILATYGFSCQVSGAVITARISNIGEDEMTAILNSIGRLLAYTRQLDAVLNADEAVDQYAAGFLSGDYRL